MGYFFVEISGNSVVFKTREKNGTESTNALHALRRVRLGNQGLESMEGLECLGMSVEYLFLEHVRGVLLFIYLVWLFAFCFLSSLPKATKKNLKI
jgi:hypothetical protein